MDETLNQGELFRGNTVLVDGMWDNANYWFRLAIVLRIGRPKRIIGVIGEHNRLLNRIILKLLGADEVIDFYSSMLKHRLRDAALDNVVELANKEGFSAVKFPANFPWQAAYDGLLKKQRSSCLDCGAAGFKSDIAQAYGYCSAAESIFQSKKIDVVIASHMVDVTYGSLCWLAVKNKGIAIVLTGDFGQNRFLRIEKFPDLFNYPGRPTKAELESLDELSQAHYRDVGKNYLNDRFSGRTDDVGATFAFQKRSGRVDRNSLCARYDWNPLQKVVGIYCSNWFDFPHAHGLSEYRDFLDWLEETVRAIESNTDINWVVKPHPCDDWYGAVSGRTAKDLVDSLNVPHVKLCDSTWCNSDLIETFDGIVTCHGSIGLEASSRGKPVLVPYKGWYGHAGFVSISESRAHYARQLEEGAWLSSTIDNSAVELFVGVFYGGPEWLEEVALRDDSLQGDNYLHNNRLLLDQMAHVVKEYDCFGNWLASGHPYFNIYRNIHSHENTKGDTRV